MLEPETPLVILAPRYSEEIVARHALSLASSLHTHRRNTSRSSRGTDSSVQTDGLTSNRSSRSPHSDRTSTQTFEECSQIRSFKLSHLSKALASDLLVSACSVLEPRGGPCVRLVLWWISHRTIPLYIQATFISMYRSQGS